MGLQSLEALTVRGMTRRNARNSPRTPSGRQTPQGYLVTLRIGDKVVYKPVEMPAGAVVEFELELPAKQSDKRVYSITVEPRK